ncbi:MAG: putative ATPase [Chthonomonadaceae bacterium]|nr:putative ATPase [Chthonomonadaceae bacterium]
MLEERWRITLCGGLTARQGVQVITRFRTQKTGLLLAYLALHGECAHGREELAERFWPESDRPLHSLRLALASLRRQLEPPGVGQGQVLIADRSHVRLAVSAVQTDVADFHAAVAEASRLDETGQKTRLLREGVEAISGELLPGSYLEWVLQARELFAEQFQGVLKELVGLLAVQEEWEQALLYALRWVHLNSLEEEAHFAVMQLLTLLKRPADVLQQFQRLRTLLWEEMRLAPSPHVCDVAAAAGTLPGSFEPAAEAVPIRTPSHAKSGVAPPGVKSGKAPASAPVTAASSIPIPALSSVRLPLPLTPFFGREKELLQLGSLLASPVLVEADSAHWQPTPRTWKPRIVTLLGTGGSGKTRLAIEVARACAASGDLAVCFAALADADTLERMMQLIAEAVCPNASADLAPHDVILSALGGVSALLILDNMEQMAEAGAGVVSTLLQRLPDLTLLVTSRVRLNLDGEREFALLPLPTPEQVDTPECLLEFASVQLFVDRAQAACADFQLTVRNAVSVVALCRRLEGLPLALELAASWAQTLSPGQMLARLDRRFELLRARRKGMATRHQALDVCIEWSFRLLRPEVQGFFCRMCLLRGVWTLETAEMMTADGEALDKLQRLREASFLLVREVACAEGTVLRFHMLESLREFGLEQLAPSEFDTGYERLTRYLLDLPHPDPFGSVDAENVRAAIQWCQTSEVGQALELSLLNALMHFWCNRGGWTEGRSWMQEALARHAQGTTLVQRKAWNTLGVLNATLGDNAQARICFDRVLADSEQTGDAATAVRALNNLAIIASREGGYVDACALLEQSLRFAEKLEDARLVTMLTHNVGSAHLNLGHDEEAREYFEQSLRQSKELGLPGGVALCLSSLAGVARKAKDLLTARRMYEESLEIFRGNGEQPRVAEILGHLAELLEAQGDSAQAHALIDESALLRQRLE